MRAYLATLLPYVVCTMYTHAWPAMHYYVVRAAAPATQPIHDCHQYMLPVLLVSCGMQPFQGIDDSGDPHHRFLMFRRIGMVYYAQVSIKCQWS